MSHRPKGARGTKARRVRKHRPGGSGPGERGGRSADLAKALSELGLGAPLQRAVLARLGGDSWATIASRLDFESGGELAGAVFLAVMERLDPETPARIRVLSGEHETSRAFWSKAREV